MSERKEFDEWVKKEHPHIYSMSLKDDEDSVRFKMDVDFMLSAWQASANREGYKLVPVEPTDVKLKEFQKIWLDSGCAHIMKKKIALELYKAMIGEETK